MIDMGNNRNISKIVSMFKHFSILTLHFEPTPQVSKANLHNPTRNDPGSLAEVGKLGGEYYQNSAIFGRGEIFYYYLAFPDKLLMDLF